MYTTMVMNEELTIKAIMEEELKGDFWEGLKYAVEAKATTRNSVSTNCTFKTHLRRCLSATESCKKSVSREYLFTIMKYDLLISKLR